MNVHPAVEEARKQIDAASFYELLGLRDLFAEDVVHVARRFVAENDDAKLRVAILRLDAVEERIRSLSPSIKFDKAGEAIVCAKESRAKN